MEEQTPNQFRKPIFSRPYRGLDMAAVALGVLFIVGGIVLGLTGDRGKKNAKLSEYSPVIFSPSPDDEKTRTIAAALLADRAEKKSRSSEAPAVPATRQPAKTPKDETRAGSVKGSTVTRPAAMAISPLPEIKPTESLPLYVSKTELPIYQTHLATPSPAPSLSPSPSPIQLQTVSLKVPGASYNVVINGEVKVIDVLRSEQSNGLTIKTQSYAGLGELIVEINGQSQGDGKFWTYTVNGNCVPLGISGQTVKDGDAIVFYLTTATDSPCS